MVCIGSAGFGWIVYEWEIVRWYRSLQKGIELGNIGGRETTEYEDMIDMMDI